MTSSYTAVIQQNFVLFKESKENTDLELWKKGTI